jgi:signal transduction histidine kinase
VEVIEHHRQRGPGHTGAPTDPLARWLASPRLTGALALSLVLASWLALAPASADQAGPWLVRLATLSMGVLLWRQSVLRWRAERFVAARGNEVAARTRWLDAVSGLSPDAVLVFERDTEGQLRLVFTNPAFSALFGLRPEELLGLSETAADEWLAGLASDDRPMPPLQGGDVKLELAGPPQRTLQRTSREDRAQRVYYFRDITHETAVERLKSEFLTTAAHELRTPLASVYGFSELLLAQRLSDERRRQLSEVVHRQAGVLKHLVDELLDLAQLDARGDADFESELCDLRDIARAAIDSAAGPDEPERLQYAPGEATLWVRADPARLSQVLVNLLANGLKYSGAPAPVQLHLHLDHGDGRDWAVATVSDQGIGMSPDEQTRAFERFYRADPSGHLLGAGLGLAIVHEIVQRHGGHITLRSTPGVGSHFSVWLPLCAAPSAIVPAAEEAVLTS